MDKRRFFSKFYFVLLTCLLILPCSKDVNGAEWKAFGTGEGLVFFYDADGINRLPNNIIQVWQKIISVSEEDRVKAVQNMKTLAPTITDNWGSSIVLYEINCKNKTYALIKEASYSIENKLISSQYAEHPSHQQISPETITERLSQIVCVEKDAKKKGQ